MGIMLHLACLMKGETVKHTKEELVKFATEHDYPEERIQELKQVTPRTLGAAMVLNANISIVEKIDLLSGD